MSTSAVSSTSLNQQLTQYFQTRQTDLQQLGQALRSGDLAGAQTAYNNITTLGQSGPFAGQSVPCEPARAGFHGGGAGIAIRRPGRSTTSFRHAAKHVSRGAGRC
jgi:hypothetical protein